MVEALGMWGRCVCGCVFVFLVVSGCAIIDPVDSRYDTVSRSLAKARNEAIFLNLIRASHNYPLDFVTIANVTPQMSNSTSFALPSFLVGPRLNGALPTTIDRDVVFGNTTASNSTSVSTNFSVSTQETQSFYQGFLKPIDLEVADYFIRQDYSRELLFWLFVESVEIDVPGHPPIGSRFNPPRDYGCNQPSIDPRQRCFSDFVLLAIGLGLTVEEKSVQTSESGGTGGSRGSGAQSDKNSSGSGPSKSQTTTTYAELCFDPILARQAQTEMRNSGKDWSQFLKKVSDFPIASGDPKCGHSWESSPTISKTPQPDYFPFQVNGINFKIKPRSAYGVFKFLGQLIRDQQKRKDPDNPMTKAYLPSGRGDEAEQPVLWTVGDDQNLMQVVRETQNVSCFVHTWFDDGDYCIPEKAETAKTIVSLLAQLIAIQTQATDLSITPLVRIAQ
jgi:hypothetical protein